MDKYIMQIENEILYEIANDYFRMPENFNEEKLLESRIIEAYDRYILDQRDIPSTYNIYMKIWVRDFGRLATKTEEIVSIYSKNLSTAERIKFYDEREKDFVMAISSGISEFIEHSGYKNDMLGYIMHYITGIGCSIYRTDNEKSEVNIIVGDAQVLMPYRLTWPCAVVGKNILIDMNRIGGGLIG